MLNTVTNFLDKVGNYINKAGNWIYKYRFIIALIIFILCVIFEISGSSIGEWAEFVNSNVTDDGVLLGTSRSVRSDEWAVLTPMMFSQIFDGFNYFSNIIRGTLTDVFMIYGLPVLNIVQIFRPFQIGFLFLGLAKGLSFFWCGRLIVLFLVSMEFFMLLTDNKKLLSFIGAIMVTLAPIVQWWFAVNGIAEILIFGELAVVILDKYMCNNNLKERILYLVGMVICAGGYIMVLYPAWQIPMFYIFAALAIWVIIKNRKEFKINYKDVISIVVALLVFIALMGYIFYTSWDTIQIIIDTAYPGSRVTVGGGEFSEFVCYIMNIFLPYDSELPTTTNQCNAALCFGLFPVGLILAFYLYLKKDKKDLPTILMLIVYAIFAFWAMFGLPEILSKLTLLSNTTAVRIYLAIGFLDVVILIRSLSLIKKPFGKLKSIIWAFIISGILVYLCESNYKDYITLKRCIIMLIISIYLIYFAFRFNSKYGKAFFTVGIVVVMLISGATVNPIRTGVDVIYDSDIISAVQEIDNNEEGKWIVEGLGFPISNYILMAGVSVINSTNVYPDLEKWSLFDETGEYEEIYNRYAHINVNLINSDEEENIDTFILNQADVVTINLRLEDLKTLEVKYIFTASDLSKMSTDEINIEKIYDNYGYYIYKLN